jgi:large subunit ribosomal protein L4
MATIDILNQNKEKVGTLTLSDDVFATRVNRALVHQVIKAQLADRRQGTAKTKTKSEVRGGGAKPFKQKGTGNARQGSTRSPLNPGGGQTFGPVPRSYAERTPKEMMKGALRSALSDRFAAKRVIILDQLTFPVIKTKDAEKVLMQTLGLQNALVVITPDKNVELSTRNIKGLKVIRTEGVNVLDIVKHDWLVLTQDVARGLETRLQR